MVSPIPTPAQPLLQESTLALAGRLGQGAVVPTESELERGLILPHVWACPVGEIGS